MGILFAGLLLAWIPVFWTARFLGCGLGSNMANVAADPEGDPSLEQRGLLYGLSGVRVPTSRPCDLPCKAGILEGVHPPSAESIGHQGTWEKPRQGGEQWKEPLRKRGWWLMARWLPSSRLWTLG